MLHVVWLLESYQCKLSDISGFHSHTVVFQHRTQTATKHDAGRKQLTQDWCQFPQQSGIETVYLGCKLDLGHDNWQHLEWITRCPDICVIPLRVRAVCMSVCVGVSACRVRMHRNLHVLLCLCIVTCTWVTCIIYKKPLRMFLPAASLLKHTDGI